MLYANKWSIYQIIFTHWYHRSIDQYMYYIVHRTHKSTKVWFKLKDSTNKWTPSVAFWKTGRCFAYVYLFGLNLHAAKCSLWIHNAFRFSIAVVECCLRTSYIMRLDCIRINWFDQRNSLVELNTVGGAFREPQNIRNWHDSHSDKPKEAHIHCGA